MGDKFFSLFLMLFGGQIGDLCNGCFDGDFALLGVVRVGVIDPTSVFVWTTTLDLSPFSTGCWLLGRFFLRRINPFWII